MRFLFLLIFLPTVISAQINPAYIFKENLNYTKLEVSGDGMFGFEKDGKVGYMDKNEKLIIPAIYSIEGSVNYPTIPSFSKGYVRLKKDGKYGILDKTGKIVVPFDYEYLSVIPLLGTHATVGKKEGSKMVYGVINMQNNLVINLEYDDLLSDSNLIALKQNGKWGLINSSGKKILPFEYPNLTPYAKSQMVRTEKDGKFIFIDLNGNSLFEKTKSVYTVYAPAQGMILCTVSSKYGFLDLKGNEVIVTKYDYALSFENNGLAKVGKKIAGTTYTYHYGYIDKKGNEVIPLKYESLGTFINGFLIAKDPETNRYGYLDKTGKWIIKPTYLDGMGFDDFGGVWVKMTDGKWHYLNKTGKDFGVFNETTYKSFNKDGYAVYEKTDYPYVAIDKTGKVLKTIDDIDVLYQNVEGIAGYKSKANAKYGFLDLNGNKIIAPEYDGFSTFDDGIAKVDKKIDGKTKSGYIDSKGNIILPIVYETAGAFRNGWGLVKKDSNYFFVDKNGNIKDPPRRYDDVYEFRSGFAVGRIKGSGTNPHTYYYINPQLKEEFSVKAMQAYLFWEDVAVVSTNNVDYELMNKKGEIFKKLTGIQTLKFCANGMLAVKENNKWGYANDKGDMIVKAQYDSTETFKFGYGRVKKNGKWGIVDKTGTEIIEPKYDYVFPGENGLVVYYDKYWGLMDKTGKVLLPPTYYSLNWFEKDKSLARLGKSYTILKSPLAK